MTDRKDETADRDSREAVRGAAAHDGEAQKARRELQRLAGEGDFLAMPRLRARGRSVRDHFAAADADRADPLEVWGTRIGRALALFAFVLVAIWLYRFLGG